MPKTFAFSNKGNYWKTRYSFTPAQYSTINKYMYSYPVQVTTGAQEVARPIPYLHDYGSAPCRWFGTQSSSAVAFTFNDNVSTNKMYRSLSIEGTVNTDATAQLIINNSRDNNQKITNSLNFREKGGILYSPLSGSQQRSNKSIVTLGTILRTDAVSYNGGRLILRLEMNWVKGAKAKLFNSTTQTTGLFTLNWDGTAGQISKFTFPSNTGTPSALANWQAADSTIFNTSVGGNEVTGFTSNFDGNRGFLVAIDFNDIEAATAADPEPITVPATQADAVNILVARAGNLWGIGALAAGIQLVALSPDDVNGAKPQGQYADMVINLGTNDYEIYAFNAYYQPNTLDHSK